MLEKHKENQYDNRVGQMDDGTDAGNQANIVEFVNHSNENLLYITNILMHSSRES